MRNKMTETTFAHKQNVSDGTEFSGIFSTNRFRLNFPEFNEPNNTSFGRFGSYKEFEQKHPQESSYEIILSDSNLRNDLDIIKKKLAKYWYYIFIQRNIIDFSSFIPNIRVAMEYENDTKTEISYECYYRKSPISLPKISSRGSLERNTQSNLIISRLQYDIEDE